MTRVNNQEQQYQKPGMGAIFGGIVAGSLVQSATSAPMKVISPKIMSEVGKISQNLTTDEFNNVEKALSETLKKSGLAEKGVSFIKATEKNSDEIINIMKKDSSSVTRFLPEKIQEAILAPFKNMVKNGVNAIYVPGPEKIVRPEKELSLTLFHEVGHAANNHLSAVGKMLQKCRRPIALLALPISLIALWKTKKAPNEKPKGTVDKTTTFIKQNAGKLTFLAFLPSLIEEAMASIKGIKFAKEAGLSTELLAKITKTNKLTYLTYLGLMLLGSIGISLGVKVKDSIAKPKPVNQN